MRLNVPNEYLPLIVKSLEQYYAYTRAVNRDDSRYQQAADWFKQSAVPAPVTIRPALKSQSKTRRRAYR